MAKKSTDEVDDDVESARATAFKAEVLRLIQQDGEVREALLKTVSFSLQEVCQQFARIYDLKPESFRRPLPGIHVGR